MAGAAGGRPRGEGRGLDPGGRGGGSLRVFCGGVDAHDSGAGGVHRLKGSAPMPSRSSTFIGLVAGRDERVREGLYIKL